MTSPSAEDTLAAHLDWVAGAWLGFVFAERADEVAALMAQVQPAAAEMVVVTPRTPQELREGVPRLLQGPAAPLTWVVACFGADPSPWWDAADWFLMRANERRQPLLDHLGGGLLITLPVAYRSRVPEAAPDLWSIRALVLDLPRFSPDTPPVAPVARRVDTLLRRLAFQKRMRTDPWHGRIVARNAEDRQLLSQRIQEALPDLSVRPDGPAALWVGLPPGEASPSLSIDLDAPLPADAQQQDPTPDAPPRLDDPLAAIDATLRTAAATWSQGWASETLELAERALDGLSDSGPDDDRRRAAALELSARARRELADRPGALERLHRAARLRRELLCLHGQDRPQRQRELARALSLRGQVLLEGPTPEAARADLEEALELRQELAQWTDDPETLGELALSHSLLADAWVATNDAPDTLRAAEAACREALALRRRIADAVPAPRHRRQLGLAWGRLGRILDRQVFLGEAERAWATAVREAAEVARASALPVHIVEESVARTQLAAVRWRRGDRQGARQEVAQAILQRRQLLADDPANARWAERLAVALGQGAQQALDEGDLLQAKSWASEAVQVGEQLVPGTGSQVRGLALAHLRLGDVHAAAGDGDAAQVCWQRARSLLPALEAHSPARAAQLVDALELRRG